MGPDPAITPKSEAQLAAERMNSVEMQVVRARKLSQHGIRARILCPYCQSWNEHDGSMLCCDTLRKAVITVLVAQRALKTAQAMERHLVN